MGKHIAFLLGAGASTGASTLTRPYPPPVMIGLYDRLAAEFPDEWGPSSRLGGHASEFRENFEAAFTEFVLKMPNNRSLGISPPTLNLLEGQRTLAIYFSQFSLVPDGTDCYSKLILAVKNSGCLTSCIFGSLNYDCLFEEAASLLGYCVDYSCRTIRADEIRVAKIHGSCNFVTPVLSQMDQAMLSASNVAYEMGFDPLQPVNLEQNLRKALSSRMQLRLPVMSQISPGKEHWLAPVKIQEYRNTWLEQTRGAEALAIIGISHNPNDTHILELVRELSVPIHYIGDDINAAKWKTENSRVTHVDEYFEPGLDKLLAALS